jgi:hypothetical protein
MAGHDDAAVIAGLDPAIHVADKSAWTTGSSPVVTNCRLGLSAAKPTRLDRREGVGTALRAFAHHTLASSVTRRLSGDAALMFF